MPLPSSFLGRFSVPVIAAPMFLISGPELVIACCRAGVAGTFPALNTRTTEEFGAWLSEIGSALAPAAEEAPAPYGVNLILHPSNTRLDADLAVLVAHRVPFVITSLGHPGQVIEAVHGYGGVVFSDAIHAKHARKAIDADVDGLIAVGSGAGGHAGTQSLFSLARELRSFWDGPLVLGGAISDGQGVRAAEVLGADLAYLGSRFIATQECRAVPAFKQMVLDASAADIVYTDLVSGTHANMLLKSLQQAYGADWQREAGQRRADGPKAWRDVWSAGHGVATIGDVPSAAALIARLRTEYLAASALPLAAALRTPQAA
ncbi:NAD(P)H-dependent flavin oxidoreductase [Variovorax ginsengisoli]|uniref:Nitronate monooxygenase n=1 Tax=Variovorax ginsengisoli TaxID=363844 RepID=A0ABT9SAS1_9BURK|nr:nitronate monooxygenase [Variovorax ginsengisoli]MDP9901009.1 nitronate monooxygenase [Variovorax ginsengisoli]